MKRTDVISPYSKTNHTKLNQNPIVFIMYNSRRLQIESQGQTTRRYALPGIWNRGDEKCQSTLNAELWIHGCWSRVGRCLSDSPIITGGITCQNRRAWSSGQKSRPSKQISSQTNGGNFSKPQKYILSACSLTSPLSSSKRPHTKKEPRSRRLGERISHTPLFLSPDRP